LFWRDASTILVRPRANVREPSTYFGNSCPLHFWTLGGVYTRWLWLIFGVLLTLLSASGVVVFVKRCKKDMQQNQTAFSRALLKMSGWGYLSMALILTAFIAWSFREY